MTTTTKTTTDREQQARELAAMWVLTETNEGTFSAHECCRAVGTGDPAFGSYRIYTRVGDGATRREGCDPARAPGYARKFRVELSARQRELAELRKLLAG